MIIIDYPYLKRMMMNLKQTRAEQGHAQSVNNTVSTYNSANLKKFFNSISQISTHSIEKGLKKFHGWMAWLGWPCQVSWRI